MYSMAQRRDRKPPISLRLPLDPPLDARLRDDARPRVDSPSPTVFISYSHDTQAHVQRVARLAEELTTTGLRCEIDKSQTSPPQGWPVWMQQRIEKSDFVVVVCTEIYTRRFTGCEAPGKGKGAVWEGRLINQCLYESAENRRFIPVVFERHDLDHIPLVLKGATYYDLSTPNGYSDLREALVPPAASTSDRPGSPIKPRFTERKPSCTEVQALLGLCPDPLPVAVLGRAIDQDAATVAEILCHLRERSAGDAETRLPPVASSQDDSVLAAHLWATALQAELDFVENHRDAAGRGQLFNVIALTERVAKGRTGSAQVSRTFRTIQTMLKDLGDKRLVLRIARQSIAASKSDGRTRNQVKDEAVATIYGVSWVYQRTGRLAEALAEAEHSMDLGKKIGWERNTAFCCKCIGRLHRMRSEAVADAKERAAALKASGEFLRNAIRTVCATRHGRGSRGQLQPACAYISRFG